MSTTAKAQFKVTNWDEQPYDESGPKLTRASVTQAYTGDIVGEGKVEYLMAYREDGSASYVSSERVVGRLGGREGSFVLQGSGTFEGGTARVRYSVVPGSGTGDIANLRGEGGIESVHGAEYSTATLNYDFD
jgi:hypothetical protein